MHAPVALVERGEALCEDAWRLEGVRGEALLHPRAGARAARREEHLQPRSSCRQDRVGVRRRDLRWSERDGVGVPQGAITTSASRARLQGTLAIPTGVLVGRSGSGEVG